MQLTFEFMGIHSLSVAIVSGKWLCVYVFKKKQKEAFFFFILIHLYNLDTFQTTNFSSSERLYKELYSIFS